MSYYEEQPPSWFLRLAFTLVLCSLLILLHTSCATLTEEERYERADAIQRSQEEFDRRHHACTSAGGMVVVKRRSGGRIPKPYTKYEMETATCTF